MASAAVQEDVRVSAGLYDFRQAARMIALPEQTLHRWARGYEDGAPILHMTDRDPRRESSVPFIALAEAWVLLGMREAGVNPKKFRPAIDRLQKEFGLEYVLMAPQLATDGIDILWDFARTKAGEGTIVAHSGQRVIREIVTGHLQYLSIADDLLPERLDIKAALPSRVSASPRVMFGQPIFVESGARLIDVTNMIKAGEDIGTVADEHGVSVDDVRTAIRIFLGRSA